MNFDLAVQAFDALSQPARLRIFQLLVDYHDKGLTPTELSALLDNMPRNTLSFHLSILTQAGLCSFEKKGRMIIYKPKCCHMKAIAEYLIRDCCPN